MTKRTSTTSRSSRLVAAGALLFQFFVQIVLSGIATAWVIVRPGERPRPGLVRMRFGDLDETGAAILGCMLTLTPGSTALDVDLERGELLLHLLDASDPEAKVRAIRHKFESHLECLFPREGA